MKDIQVDIMQEVHSAIVSQIEEIAYMITTQVKTAIKEAILQLTSTTTPNQHIEMEPDNETELITQESQPTHENITDMNLEKERRKIKGKSTQKVIEGPLLSIPT